VCQEAFTSVKAVDGFGETALVLLQHVAALQRGHLGAGFDFGLDPLQNGDNVLGNGLGRIITDLIQEVFRIRTTHRHRFQVLLERQQVLFILQQDDPLPPGPPSFLLPCRNLGRPHL